MEADEITHWLELPAGTGFVLFSELAHLIAKALHPVEPEDEEYDFAYGCARVNLEEELPKAVAAKLLKVRDPLTHGLHAFPPGFVLQSAVVRVSDLRAFLADRGMGVRVTEAGNGPTHWTIGNAAAAIAAQEGWHEHARDTLQEQMMQAARDGTLTVRHPHTDIPYRPDPVRDFYETVTPADVNSWLARDPANSLKWLHAVLEPGPSAEPAPDVPSKRAPKFWTEERKEQLRAYREKHGTKKAAEHFGVSCARVRQLLPTGKTKTKGYSAFTHRIK